MSLARSAKETEPLLGPLLFADIQTVVRKAGHGATHLWGAMCARSYRQKKRMVACYEGFPIKAPKSHRFTYITQALPPTSQLPAGTNQEEHRQRYETSEEGLELS